jgi:alkanesulfonate monooxygenase SsuD/methylene tetrahydromethanopterin reductase-like flavin-dependent oxidoreductase (luciferase family)
MLILFDQGTPVGIRNSLSGHVVRTAREQGWSTLLNGELLRAAEQAGFDILLTTDRNLVYQQNLNNRTIAIVALSRNRWSLIQPALQRIALAVSSAQPGSYTLVNIPGK